MWHYPNNSCNELLELVLFLLLSKPLAFSSHKLLIELVQSFNTDVWDLGHHCSQLHVARTLTDGHRCKYTN